MSLSNVPGSSDSATENDLSEIIPVTSFLKLYPDVPTPVVLLELTTLSIWTWAPVSKLCGISVVIVAIPVVLL